MLPQQVKIVEVGARDGLQNESQTLGVAERIAFIEKLQDCGLRAIEVGSFTSPKWTPQMAGTADVLRGVRKLPGVAYPALVPNMRGLEDALAAGAREIAVFAAASETFSRKNINCGIDESFARFAEVTAAALAEKLRVRGYVSCVLGCPYEGEVALSSVARVCEKLFDLGCYEVSLGDTIGVGTPGKVTALLECVGARVRMEHLAAHFHDTYGQALANLYAALQAGVATIDSSVAGLGGCPYAKGASGNVASEDVVYMLHGLGIDSGVDLQKLVKAGEFICAKLNKPPASKVALAMRA